MSQSLNTALKVGEVGGAKGLSQNRNTALTVGEVKERKEGEEKEKVGEKRVSQILNIEPKEVAVKLGVLMGETEEEEGEKGEGGWEVVKG